jgi:hypothetical protein
MKHSTQSYTHRAHKATHTVKDTLHRMNTNNHNYNVRYYMAFYGVTKVYLSYIMYNDPWIQNKSNQIKSRNTMRNLRLVSVLAEI